MGAAILARGGNAIDAAVATALTLGVINPSSSGIGGGGFAVVYVAAEHKLYALDFREVAPAALTPDRFVVDGTLQPQLSRRGGLAVGVPGEVAGLEAMWKKHGALSWLAVVEPARRLAADGFEVSWFLERAVAAVLDGGGDDSPFYRWLAPRSRPLAAGQRIRRSALAKTLGRIASQGSAAFYRGPVASGIVRAVTEAGGVMTEADLAGYQVVAREPLVGSFADYQIATMPLPSSGGLLMLEMLGILEASGVDLAAAGAGSSQALHTTAELLKHGFADRARHLGDASESRALADQLLAPERLRRLGRRVSTSRTRPSRTYGDTSLPARAVPDDSGTSHLCVIDARGNAVALTTTVNGYFGAHMVTADSGIVLNNEMDDFSLASGQANLFGLVQSDHNLVGPGKRPLSSMTPTLVLKEDRVVGCFGASGGPRIISGTFQAFLNVFVHGMSATEALDAPRIHHQWMPETLYVDAEVARDVRDGLARRGHKLDVNRYTSSVQAIVVRDNGVLEAASDPRKGGAPAGPRRGQRKPVRPQRAVAP